MAFSEPIRLAVKRKADFTCCWCRDRRNKVEIHHIIPQTEGGPNDEDNAAPLCGSCHDLFGGNPELRKEIRLRRDQWYEICSKVLNPEYNWPIGLDVPLLGFSRKLPPTSSIATEGIQFTDKDPNDSKNPPLLYLSIYFKQSKYFGRNAPSEQEKWLYIEANMRFALNLRIQVRAWNNRDTLELMRFLTNNKDKYLPEFIQQITDESLRQQFLQSRDKGWNLHGPPPENDKNGAGDYLRVWRENDENRLMISTFTSTHAGISVHARFSDEVAIMFADYLEKMGFAESSKDSRD